MHEDHKLWFWIQPFPLLPQTANYTCSISVCTHIISQHSPFHPNVYLSNVPFWFVKGKVTCVCLSSWESSDNSYCAAVAGLMKVVLETGARLEDGMPGKPDHPLTASTFCLRFRKMGLWIWSFELVHWCSNCLCTEDAVPPLGAPSLGFMHVVTEI